MRLIDLLTYRGTLMLLNGVSGALGALAMLMTMQARSAGPPVLMLLAAVLGFAAFATPRRHKPLLLAAVLVNALLLLVTLPFMYFAMRNGAPLHWFSAMVFVFWAAPALTIFASWARWPRVAAV